MRWGDAELHWAPAHPEQDPEQPASNVPQTARVEPEVAVDVSTGDSGQPSQLALEDGAETTNPALEHLQLLAIEDRSGPVVELTLPSAARAEEALVRTGESVSILIFLY